MGLILQIGAIITVISKFLESFLGVLWMWNIWNNGGVARLEAFTTLDNNP
jgi:hypothetical protein